MTTNDVLMLIYNYRNHPAPESVPHLFKFLSQERTLWQPSTAIPFAGVVTGLIERHPIQYEAWRADHKQLLHQAISISKSPRAKEETLWAEYLLMRWFILGTDKAAWELLKLCHYASSEALRVAAQTVTSKVTRMIDHAPHINANGKLLGKVQYDDMRLQMLRLANEFRRFTPGVRQQPFELLPFSPESVQAQMTERAGLPLVGPEPASLLLH